MGVDILLEKTARFFRKQKGLRIFFLFLIGVVVAIGAQGCDGKNGEGGPSDAHAGGPCGKFECLKSNALGNQLGAEYKVAFKFQPADCGNNCRCGKIAYVQIARIVSHDGIYFDDGDHTRLIVTGIEGHNGEEHPDLNGWFIDQFLDAKYGYYGMDLDGTFSAEHIEAGSNTNTSQKLATLFDMPTGMQLDSLVEFVDIPVCLDPNASCKNGLLGYSHWWFTVGKEGSSPSIEGPNVNFAPNDERLNVLKKAVQLAVIQWNVSASSRGQGIEKFPDDMSPMR